VPAFGDREVGMTATADQVPADVRAAIDELGCIARSGVALAREHIPRTARDPALANAIRDVISAVDGIFALLDHHDEAVRRAAMYLVPGLATCGAVRDGEFPALGHRRSFQPEAELADIANRLGAGPGSWHFRVKCWPRGAVPGIEETTFWMRRPDPYRSDARLRP
jgi:hypothetical protein